MVIRELATLDEYPHLRRVFDLSFRRGYAERHHSAPDGLFRTLCDPDERATIFRLEFERLLKTGFESGFVDDDLLGRLRSGDDRNLASARSELETWSFFHERGFPLMPRPPGKAARRGDLRITTEPSVHVEVKAILDREDEEQETRVASKLQKCCHETSGVTGWITLEVLQVAQDFSGRAFKSWLRRSTAEGRQTKEYEDQSGLIVKVSWTSSDEEMTHPYVVHMFGVRSSQSQNFAYSSVKNACEQLPADGPSLVILRSFLSLDHLDDWSLQSTLYGPYSVYIGTGNRDGYRLSFRVPRLDLLPGGGL